MTCLKETINPCYKCGQQPDISTIYDLWYVKCVRCEQIFVNPRLEVAVENWNEFNPLAEKLTKRKKKGKTFAGLIIPIYKLDDKGNRVERYVSAQELSAKLGYKSIKQVSSLFSKAKSDTIQIRGITYVRDRTEATPAPTRGRRKKKILVR